MINDLIGKQFSDGGRGPDTYDCYGVLREVYRRYGVDIPDQNVSVYAAEMAQGLIDSEKLKWIEIDNPETPCAVLMRPHAGFAQHIGVYVDGWVIHTKIGHGVIAEKLYAVKRKVEGYYKWSH